MKAIRRIMHPTDFSSASGPAFVKATELAGSQRAELILLHVADAVVPVAPEGYISPAVYDEIQRSARAYGQRKLAALVARAKKAGVRATPVMVEGAPASAIVRAAKSRRADMIVMGTHGRSGLARLFLGSVAERVVGQAPCPVLTVRGRSR
jgi:nucleotide-binding universal stress UspA family protein